MDCGAPLQALLTQPRFFTAALRQAIESLEGQKAGLRSFTRPSRSSRLLGYRSLT